MLDKFLNILGYIVGVIGAILISPFALLYFIVRVFWHIFGTVLISYIILSIIGFNEVDCAKYSVSLGLLLTIIFKYREIKNK